MELKRIFSTENTPVGPPKHWHQQGQRIPREPGGNKIYKCMAGRSTCHHYETKLYD
jgi:hypothetical protein